MVDTAHLIQRKGIWHLFRRVPKRFARVDARPMFSKSLETDSVKDARRKADDIWDAQQLMWQAKLDGRSDDARAAFEAMRKIAQSRGFSYLPVFEVVKISDEALLSRIEAVQTVAGVPSKDEASALLGTAENPPLRISEVWDEFFKLSSDARTGKSADQIRKWGNPIKLALNNWIAVNGNGELTSIRREDFINFREFWIEKIELEERSPNTANKNFVMLTSALNKVIDGLGLNFTLPIPVRNWRLRSVDPVSPPPFSSGWIRDRLLAKGALNGLNAEARAILLICINTGARPSEIATLLPDRIVLSSNTPHIQIRPDGRVIKTKASKRDIPLVGIALEAARAFPDGFPRYRDNPSSLSAAQLKFLRSNGLMQSDEHFIYSLRHSFEDRMEAAKFSERSKADLMGHGLNRERYGAGLSLLDTSVALEAISF